MCVYIQYIHANTRVYHEAQETNHKEHYLSYHYPLLLRMRYPDYFPDAEEAKKLQKSVEKVINQSLSSTLGSRVPSKRQRDSAEIRTPQKPFRSSPRTSHSSQVSGRLKASKKYRRVVRRHKAHKRSYMRRKYFK